MATRTKQHREAGDLGAMLERMMRALVRRAAEGDIEALRELRRLSGVVDASIDQAGGALYATGYYSWTNIADEVGVTRQAARQRFGAHVPPAQQEVVA